MAFASYQPIGEKDSLVVRTIKEMLNGKGGKALIPLYSGELFEIGYDTNGKGLATSKIPVRDQLTWEVFDAAVEVVLNYGGKVPKGKARTGAKLGSENLPLESLEGYIGHKVHGVEIGKSAFGPGFVVAAILDWAGVCNNERGFISMKAEYTCRL